VAIEEGRSVLTIDLKNAFNAVSRCAIEKAVMNDPKMNHLRQYFRFVYYGELTTYAMSEGKLFEVDIAEGVRQGDLPASQLFCSAIEPIIQSMLGDDVEVKAYLDDITVTARDPMTLIRKLQDVRQAFATIGLETNMDKCELFINAPAGTHLEAESTARALNLKVVTTREAFKLLGAAIGAPTEVEAQRVVVRKKLANVHEWFTRIRHQSMPKKLAFQLLRICGTPRFDYMCAANTPEVMQPIYTQFDDLVKATFMDLFGTAENMTEKHGGFMPCFEKDGPEMHHVAMRRAQGIADSQVPKPKDAIPPFTPTPLGSHQRAVRGNNAARFMHLTEETTEMGGKLFVAAMQHRLGFWNPGLFGERCAGCKKPFAACAIENYAHVLSCRYSRVSFNHRHEELASAVHNYLVKTGFNVRREPEYCGDHDNKRQDLEIEMDGRNLVIDFTIIVNTCPSHCKHENALQRAANDKTVKHAENVGRYGHNFCPLVFNTSGEMHHGVDEFITKLASIQEVMTKQRFKQNFLFVISNALHSGVAKCVLAAQCREFWRQTE
jgi:hypothetical protein